MSSLAAKRVVITRAASQSDMLATLLRDRGAAPVLYPCIDIVPLPDASLLDAALRVLLAGNFDWLVFTSANTVSAVAARLEMLGGLGMKPPAQIAAVGPGTAGAARRMLGAKVDAMPAMHLAEALPEAMGNLAGARVLLPQADLAGPELAKSLAGCGAVVTPVVAYQNDTSGGGEDVPAQLAAGQIDAVTLLSASAARNFLDRLVDEGGSSADLQGVCIACIGPKTADAASEAGLSVDVVAADHTQTGLVDTLAAFYSRQP